MQGGRQMAAEEKKPQKNGLARVQFGLRMKKIHDAMLPAELHTFEKQIIQVNNKNLRGVLFGLTILFGLSVVLQLLSGPGEFFTETIYVFGFFAVSDLVYISIEKYIVGSSTVASYIWYFILLFGDMLFEASIHPDNPGYIFPLMLIAMALSVMDAALRITVAIVTVCAVYFLMMGMSATPEVLWSQSIQLLLTAIISLYFNYRLTWTHLKSLKNRNVAMDSAEHDGLTGILNRRGGDEMIKEYLAHGITGTFILADIDNFKYINDNYGHARGDEILKAVADVMRRNFRSTDVVMRMGGDEFIIYATGIQDYNVVVAKLRDVREELHKIRLSDHDDKCVTMSMGCVINLGSYPNYDSMYAISDRLLYKVKKRGKDDFCVTDMDFAEDDSKDEDVDETSDNKDISAVAAARTKWE